MATFEELQAKRLDRTKSIRDSVSALAAPRLVTPLPGEPGGPTTEDLVVLGRDEDPSASLSSLDERLRRKYDVPDIGDELKPEEKDTSGNGELKGEVPDPEEQLKKAKEILQKQIEAGRKKLDEDDLNGAEKQRLRDAVTVAESELDGMRAQDAGVNLALLIQNTLGLPAAAVGAAINAGIDGALTPGNLNTDPRAILDDVFASRKEILGLDDEGVQQTAGDIFNRYVPEGPRAFSIGGTDVNANDPAQIAIELITDPLNWVGGAGILDDAAKSGTKTLTRRALSSIRTAATDLGDNAMIEAIEAGDDAAFKALVTKPEYEPFRFNLSKRRSAQNYSDRELGEMVVERSVDLGIDEATTREAVNTLLGEGRKTIRTKPELYEPFKLFLPQRTAKVPFVGERFTLGNLPLGFAEGGISIAPKLRNLANTDSALGKALYAVGTNVGGRTGQLFREVAKSDDYFAAVTSSAVQKAARAEARGIIPLVRITEENSAEFWRGKAQDVPLDIDLDLSVLDDAGKAVAAIDGLSTNGWTIVREEMDQMGRPVADLADNDVRNELVSRIRAREPEFSFNVEGAVPYRVPDEYAAEVLAGNASILSRRFGPTVIDMVDLNYSMGSKSLQGVIEPKDLLRPSSVTDIFGRGVALERLADALPSAVEGTFDPVAVRAALDDLDRSSAGFTQASRVQQDAVALYQESMGRIATILDEDEGTPLLLKVKPKKDTRYLAEQVIGGDESVMTTLRFMENPGARRRAVKSSVDGTGMDGLESNLEKISSALLSTAKGDTDSLLSVQAKFESLATNLHDVADYLDNLSFPVGTRTRVAGLTKKMGAQRWLMKLANGQLDDIALEPLDNLLEIASSGAVRDAVKDVRLSDYSRTIRAFGERVQAAASVLDPVTGKAFVVEAQRRQALAVSDLSETLERLISSPAVDNVSLLQRLVTASDDAVAVTGTDRVAIEAMRLLRIDDDALDTGVDALLDETTDNIEAQVSGVVSALTVLEGEDAIINIDKGWRVLSATDPDKLVEDLSRAKFTETPVEWVDYQSRRMARKIIGLHGMQSFRDLDDDVAKMVMDSFDPVRTTKSKAFKALQEFTALSQSIWIVNPSFPIKNLVAAFTSNFLYGGMLISDARKYFSVERLARRAAMDDALSLTGEFGGSATWREVAASQGDDFAEHMREAYEMGVGGDSLFHTVQEDALLRGVAETPTGAELGRSAGRGAGPRRRIAAAKEAQRNHAMRILAASRVTLAELTRAEDSAVARLAGFVGRATSPKSWEALNLSPARAAEWFPSVEGHARTSLYVARRQAGDSIEQALNKVTLLHVDYGDFTQLEASLKVWSPFFMWRSRATKTAAQLVLRKPGSMRLALGASVVAQAEGRAALQPEWLDGEGRIPLGGGFSYSGGLDQSATALDNFGRPVMYLLDGDIKRAAAETGFGALEAVNPAAKGLVVVGAGLNPGDRNPLTGSPTSTKLKALPGGNVPALRMLYSAIPGAVKGDDDNYYGSSNLASAMGEFLPVLDKIDQNYGKREGYDPRRDRKVMDIALSTVGWSIVRVDDPLTQSYAAYDLAGAIEDVLGQVKRSDQVGS